MTIKVRLINNDKHFTVESDENILEAAMRQGIVIPHNCRNGICGSCLGKLQSGTVVYPERNPRALTDEKAEGGYVVCCQAHPTSDIELEVETIDAVADIEIKTLPCKVKSLKKLATDVMSVELKLPPYEKFEFIAGQYLDVLLPRGKRRSFSMSNSPSANETIELQIRHVPDGVFTTKVFEEMKEKDLWRIQGPLGTFIMRDVERPAILIAGGTGLAPLKSMLEVVKEEGREQALYLYWGARSADDLYFNEQLEQWAQEIECLHYVPVLSDPDQKLEWQGATGWVHQAVLNDFESLQGFDIYASGPPPMISAIQDSFPDNGMDSARFYFDSFVYANDGE